jgi:hypothetical protein
LYLTGEFEIMKCYYHPDRDAAGTCSQCSKGACHEDLQDVGGAMLCTGCQKLAHQEIAASQAQMAAKAKTSILWSWIFTGVVGGIGAISVIGAALTPTSQYDYTTGTTSSGAAPVGLILLAPVMVYAAWSLYWGWGPVWGGVSRLLGKLGCAFQATWFIWIIVIACFFELLFLAAIAYGGLGGGFARYGRAKQLAALAM